jgi:drug/metabolite transporter (DMT)-like permease
MTAVSPNVAKSGARGSSRLAVMIAHAAVLFLQPDFRTINHSGGGTVHTGVSALGRGRLAAAPFLWMARDRVRTYVSSHPVHWLALGFLGMWICGAGVYYALQFTTATNGTLIYTTSPLMVIILERLFFGRPPSWREIAGIVVGFHRGGDHRAQGRSGPPCRRSSFNCGDLMFIAAALSWAVYSVLLKGRARPGCRSRPCLRLSLSPEPAAGAVRTVGISCRAP